MGMWRLVMKIVHVRINDHEMKMLNSGASLSRIEGDIFLKIYHSNYKEKKVEKMENNKEEFYAPESSG